MRRRNPMAKVLRTPRYKPRVVSLKRNKPLRKAKHKKVYKNESDS